MPYFAGHGGVTSPDGYMENAGGTGASAAPIGWRPDLVKSDSRIILAMLVRF